MSEQLSEKQLKFHQDFLRFLPLESEAEPTAKDIVATMIGNLTDSAVELTLEKPSNTKQVAQVMIRAYDTLSKLDVEPPFTETELSAYGGSRAAFLMIDEMTTEQPAPKAPKTSTKTTTTKPAKD